MPSLRSSIPVRVSRIASVDTNGLWYFSNKDSPHSHHCAAMHRFQILPAQTLLHILVDVQYSYDSLLHYNHGTHHNFCYIMSVQLHRFYVIILSLVLGLFLNSSFESTISTKLSVPISMPTNLYFFHVELRCAHQSPIH